MAKTYENAGVNLEAGYEVVRRIKQHVASTRRIGSMGNIGSFGGMFDLSALNVKEPVLVSGTDSIPDCKVTAFRGNSANFSCKNYEQGGG